MGGILSKFTEHPTRVCMTYAQHAKLSLTFSRMLFVASLKSVIHAAYPAMYETSTTDVVREAQALLDASGCRDGHVNGDADTSEAN